jgi:hypothetical protein
MTTSRDGTRGAGRPWLPSIPKKKKKNGKKKIIR